LGVDRVGLAPAPAGAAVGAVDLEDLEAVGAGEAGQASAVGAGAFNADALDRPEAFGPGHQGDIAAGRGRKRPRVQRPSRLVDHRGHMGLQVGVDADGDRARGCWHAFHDRSFRAARTGTARTHRDGGQHCDGASRPGSYRVTPPDRWVPSVPSDSWPTDRMQGTRPVRRRVRPATEGTTQIIAVRTFHTSSRPALRAASGRPPARQRHNAHRGARLTAHSPWTGRVSLLSTSYSFGHRRTWRTEYALAQEIAQFRL
jgi:hypothetical protein